MSNEPGRLGALRGILESAASATSTDELGHLISGFQKAVWNSEHIADASDTQEGILRELAYDLDFFVAGDRERKEDPSYFGPERARSIVAEGLRALNDAAA